MRDERTAAITLALAALMVLLAVAGVAAADPGASPAVGSAALRPVAAPSAAATEPAPSPTATPALTLTATPAVVTAGDRVRLVAGLGIPDATLRLTRQRAGDPVPVLLATLVTGVAGSAKFGVRPAVTTTYRVEYQGDGQQWLPATAEVTVSVGPRVTFAADARVYRGDKVRLSVSVRPAHAGGAVTLQSWLGGAWTDWRAVKLDAASRATATWRAVAVGTYPLRAVTAADAEHVEGRSAVRHVLVIKPNPYRVPIDAKSMIVVDISQYRLHFFSKGVEVRSFPCVTGRPSLPTPIGHFRVYARGMWPGGPYGARIMCYHPPCAIHGTDEPWLLKKFPRNFSHGCTRLYNSDAIWLYDRAPLGTPVWNVP
ncbi:MAG TPA: L,D-transpeptidase [Kineosporiaceae bacterium]|nr:L,D-transpeptidase [Kineosporiaceae bacterium]